MNPTPIGLVFPGQGTQRQGMGDPWRDTAAWSLVDEISRHCGEDVEELLLRTPTDELRRTDLAQLSVFAVAVMAHAEAVRCGALDGAVACAGHSLGEYAALVAAGVLTLPDAVTLVADRGRAMRDAAERRPGTMGVLVGAGLPEVEGLAAGVRAEGLDVWVANVNAPGQVVLSGSEDGVGRAAELAPGIAAKLIRLSVGGAFHSPFMAPAAERLARTLRGVTFAPGHLPVVANVDAEPHPGDGNWPELAVRQLVSPVRWEESVRTLTGRLGCRRLVELGPGRVLTGLIRRIAPDVEVTAVDSPAALDRRPPTQEDR
ncbi:ACP S-malonyltransferase [Streptomyces sp. BE133]|uniref:ACP S-malonyltransferase n=1 Tax=Streptomyces sp. BE133 TaxID=3002523 RepID=UPI002E788E80|nr:ACP S-malonyltransferase [Streptomyces sp. BE133]MEE1809638.1 ACP S-malonyltransferase [Streptomyces sp. BE133]